MSDFIEKLTKFVNDNKNDERYHDMWFEYANCKITYDVACEIVSELNSYKLHIDTIQLELELLQDYTRLLRKENTELKGKVEDE